MPYTKSSIFTTKINEPIIYNKTLNLIEEALKNKTLSSGPLINELENKTIQLVGSKYAVAVANASVGLEAVLKAINVGPGDEVITTPFTFASTILSILRCGAVPRFVDIGDDYVMNTRQVSTLINAKTKAIIPVHFAGYPTNMNNLLRISENYGIDIIEDAAQAIGAIYHTRRIGSIGVAGVFSFYTTKNVGAGEGGVITTSDDIIYHRLLSMRNCKLTSVESLDGMKPLIGTNFRMPELSAAVALPQLERVDEVNASRSENAHYLAKKLGGHPHINSEKQSAWNTYTVLVKDRERVQKIFSETGIETKFYYDYLLPLDPVYSSMFPLYDSFPNADRISKQCISVPIHSGVTPIVLDFIAAVLKENSV